MLENIHVGEKRDEDVPFFLPRVGFFRDNDFLYNNNTLLYKDTRSIYIILMNNIYTDCKLIEII